MGTLAVICQACTIVACATIFLSSSLLAVGAFLDSMGYPD
jgi:hypothetical protein